MKWEHKNICFTITIEPVGPLHLASARTSSIDMPERIRPFSAVGISEKDAIRLLKDQIKLEFAKIPCFKIC